MNNLPLEILVKISEYDEQVWFNLSLVLKHFAIYAIQHDVRLRAMKLFGVREMLEHSKNNFCCHYYEKCGQKHGRFEIFRRDCVETRHYWNGELKMTHIQRCPPLSEDYFNALTTAAFL